MAATVFGGALMSEIVIPSGVAISVTNSGGGPTAVSVTAGTYRTLDTFLTQLETDLETQRAPSAGGWTLSASVYPVGATGLVTITTTQGSAFSITWTSTELRDLLGFTGNISSQTSATGGLYARSIWQPNAPIYIEGSTFESAPRATDLRQSVTPTGRAYGHVSNVSYRVRGLRYSHVPVDRVWQEAETVGNESLERFMRDTQWGDGSSFFSPSSRIIVIDPSGTWLGQYTLTYPYWSLIGVSSMEDVARRIGEWDGLWAISFEQLVSANE